MFHEVIYGLFAVCAIWPFCASWYAMFLCRNLNPSTVLVKVKQIQRKQLLLDQLIALIQLFA